MYINTFKYTPKDVYCKYCTEYERKTGCTACGCPWLNERIEAGVVGYNDAVIGVFGEHTALHPRLRQLLRRWPDTLWPDGTHRLRILSLCELVVGGKDGLQPIEKTVIDRCVRVVYQPYLNDPCAENIHRFSGFSLSPTACPKSVRLS